MKKHLIEKISFFPPHQTCLGLNEHSRTRAKTKKILNWKRESTNYEKRLIQISVLFFLLFYSTVNTLQISSQFKDDHTTHLTISLPLKEDDFLYKEYVTFCVDHPEVKLSSWKTDKKESLQYDPAFKESKAVFKGPVDITLDAYTKNPEKITDANLHVTYYLKSKQRIVETVVPISFLQKEQALPLSIDINNSVETIKPIAQTNPQENIFKKTYANWYRKISTVVETSNSLWLQIVMALLLGILLSLTPCIYPMIPITAGILQSQASKSVWYNFLLSLAYTCGIATTFACLALLAAFTGQMFGSLLSNPFVILTIITLLLYLALSMIGFYEMHIPSIFKTDTKSPGGSILSAFIFGAASGTVASPCLSPGLILLLSIVTTLGNKLVGFILLFSFGVGLTLPLLVVGSFSSSLNVLPQAGMWMMEIKKVFGFLLLGMCLYFLHYLLPWYVICWMGSVLIISIGVYYLYSASYCSKQSQYAKNITGMFLIASSIFFGLRSYQATFATHTVPGIWETDLQKAVARAKEEQKKLLVDIGAPYCSICKAIDKTLFGDPEVCCSLEKCVPVKIDGSDSSNSCTHTFCKKHKVIGFPTILLLDPQTESVIQQWDGNLYNIDKNEFITQLEQKIID